MTEETFRIEVLDPTAPGESWVGNGARYPFLGEAWKAGADLLSRWTLPQAYRVMRGDDPTPWAVSTCRGCYEAMKGGMYPTHHVSPGCEHGGEPHCTGDGCF